jgi:hypothetical protein
MASFIRKKASATEIAMALAQVPDSDVSSVLQQMPSGIDLRRCGGGNKILVDLCLSILPQVAALWR